MTSKKLPANFSPIKHLNDVIRREQNQRVKEWFRDIEWQDGEEDIDTPRNSLRVACTIRSEDSSIMILNRLWLFEVICRHAQSFQTPIYGIPVTTFHDSVKFFPQVRLYFSEDQNQVEEGYSPVEAEISFRLIRESSATFTPENARVLANRIKTLFAQGNGFVWKKGREKWLYQDSSKGYDFRILAWNESEAKKLIEQVLDIQNHTPDWDLLSVATKKKSFPTVPGTHQVYGKSRRKPRERPIAYVRFRYAEAKIWGLPNDITLVDRTGFRRNPLVD